MGDKKCMVVIAGPTAVGKTALAIDLALHYQTEIISADSRQFFSEMGIGTAKPSREELEKVPHHFINTHTINETYNAGQFAVDAEEKANQLFRDHDIAIVVGGSGLYIRALCDGLDEMPAIQEGMRASLNTLYIQNGLVPLLAELEQKDPEYFAQVDQQNHQRVIRALEVIRSTGRPFSDFRTSAQIPTKPYHILKIGMEAERSLLYQRIDQRMDQMIAQGLFEEATRLHAQRHLNALQTVGYKEIFDQIDGLYDREEAVRLLKRNSRRYAKRQMTWFKKDESFHWIGTDYFSQAVQLIEELRLS